MPARRLLIVLDDAVSGAGDPIEREPILAPSRQRIGQQQRVW